MNRKHTQTINAITTFPHTLKTEEEECDGGEGEGGEGGREGQRTPSQYQYASSNRNLCPAFLPKFQWTTWNPLVHVCSNAEMLTEYCVHVELNVTAEAAVKEQGVLIPNLMPSQGVVDLQIAQ